WALLAGAAGHGYGALDLFHLYKDNDGPFPKNGFQHWRKAIAYEGSRQVGIMRRLFELRPWYKLVPDQSVAVAGQAEREDHVQAAAQTTVRSVIDRGSVGVRLELDQACKVRLGERDTVLIQLTDAPKPASKMPRTSSPRSTRPSWEYGPGVQQGPSHRRVRHQ